MSTNQSSIRNLLKRYLSGDVGARQEAELEQHAQSDEFLGEAIEGLRQQPAADHEAAVARMRSKLPKSKGKLRSLGWYRFAAAASVLLLIGVAAFLLPRWMDNSLDSVAMKEAPAERTEKAPILSQEERSNATEEVISLDANDEYVSTEATNQRTEAATIEQPIDNTPLPPPPTANPAPVPAKVDAPAVAAAKKVQPAPPITYAAPVPLEELPQAYGAEIAEEDEIAFESIEQAPVAVSPPPVIGNRFNNTATLPAGFRRITGYVTDENDQPITDANVALPGQPLGERTNEEGYFELIADNTVRQVNVIHPDYQRAEVNLPSGENEVQINLETNREASEAEDDWQFGGAISTYYPNRTPSAAVLKQGTIRELRKAIIANKPASLGTGKVRVSFSVLKDGSLTSFSWGGRSADALQAYVRRYLKENSQWELIRGEEPSRIYLVINFE